jgi:hypothetical protein
MRRGSPEMPISTRDSHDAQFQKAQFVNVCLPQRLGIVPVPGRVRWRVEALVPNHDEFAVASELRFDHQIAPLDGQ